jgi:methanogenic corrinoid protein MtbC1
MMIGSGDESRHAVSGWSCRQQPVMGKVVIGTVRGDIHGIGKTLVGDVGCKWL